MGKPNPGNDSQGSKSSWMQLARYSQLAFVFPAAIVVGLVVGTLLDRWLHTTWLYLAGLILGIIAGFVELIREAALASKQ
jgi:F0F1-type ATP synthase assembly protein I